MNQQVETMKLALEALEETRNALAWFYDSYPQDVTKKGNKLLPHVETVLTTLREALAQPQQEACPTCGEYEPRTGTCGTSPNDKRALCNRRDTSPPAQEIVCSTGLCHYRKPLTDEEIDVIGATIFNADFLDVEEVHANRELARAIEAAHGIKGDA